MTHNDDKKHNEWTVVAAYTRAQAIADGVLVDVSKLAKEAGFKVPVAVTVAVNVNYVEVPTGVTGQDEVGRLWDILWMAHCAIAFSKKKGSTLSYRLFVKNHDKKPAERVTLKLEIHPGDEGEPVVTIMLPHED